MLKVKVEPVDPSLRGNVQLPNGGTTLPDYRQLYLNPELVDDVKTGVDVEERVEEEDADLTGLEEDGYGMGSEGQDVGQGDGFTIEEGESNVIETVEESEVSLDADTRLMMVAPEQQETMAVEEVIEVPYLSSGDSMSNVVILEEEGTTQYIITEGQAPFLTSEGVDEEMTLDTSVSGGHSVVVEKLECEEEPFIPQHARGPLTPGGHYGTDLEDPEADVAFVVSKPTGKNLSKMVKDKLTRKISDRQLISNDGTASGGKKRKRKGSDATGNQAKKRSNSVKPAVGVKPVPATTVSPSALSMPYLIFSKELNTYIHVVPISSHLQEESAAEGNLAAETIARPQIVSLADTAYGQSQLVTIANPPPASLGSPKSQHSITMSGAKRTLSPIQKNHPLITSMLSRGPLSPVSLVSPVSPHRPPVTTATATATSPTVQSPIRAPDSILSKSPASDGTNLEPHPIIINVTSLATPTYDTPTTAHVLSPGVSAVESVLVSSSTPTATEVTPPKTVSTQPASNVTTLVIPVRALARAAAQSASSPKARPPCAPLTKTLLKVPTVTPRRLKSASAKLPNLTAAVNTAAVSPELKPQLSVEATAMKSILQSPTVAAVALSNEVIDLSDGDEESQQKRASQETLADRYMREWKPTGKYQCRFCVYSCVTQNFLFRHWVMNHSGVRPYTCGYCPMRSPTRDGLTRHMTAKHRDMERRVEVDRRQERLLVRRFREVFSSMFKEQAKYSEGLPIDLRMTVLGDDAEEDEEAELSEMEDRAGEAMAQMGNLMADSESEGNVAGENLTKHRVNPVTTASLMPETVEEIQSKMKATDVSNFIIILNNESGTVTVANPESPISPVPPPLHIEAPPDDTTPMLPPSPGVATSQGDADHEIMVVLENPADTEQEAAGNPADADPTSHTEPSVQGDGNFENTETICSSLQQQSVSVFNLLERAIVDTYKTDSSTKTPCETSADDTPEGASSSPQILEQLGDVTPSDTIAVQISGSAQCPRVLSQSSSVLSACSDTGALSREADVVSIESSSLDGYEIELPKALDDLHGPVEETTSPNPNSLCGEQGQGPYGVQKADTDEKS